MAATGVIGTWAIGTYASIAAAILALGLPLYQWRRDRLLPSLRRRGNR